MHSYININLQSLSLCHRTEPKFTPLVQPLDENQIKLLFSPKIIHRKLSDNKRIEPPLNYPNNASSKVSTLSAAKTRQKYRVKRNQKISVLNRKIKISFKQI